MEHPSARGARTRRTRDRVLVGVVLVLVAATVASLGTAAVAVTRLRARVSRPLSIHVAGNRLVDGSGRVVRLLGVNRPGMDVLTPSRGCWVIPASVGEINAMLAWHINAVRIPLNEDC